MSATRVVVVPSLFHSSYPAVGSYARKNTVLPIATRLSGNESPTPGLMSATSAVVVPSLFHSSHPAVGSHTWKKAVLPTATRFCGDEPCGSVFMSATRYGAGWAPAQHAIPSRAVVMRFWSKLGIEFLPSDTATTWQDTSWGAGDTHEECRQPQDRR